MYARGSGRACIYMLQRVPVSLCCTCCEEVFAKNLRPPAVVGIEAADGQQSVDVSVMILVKKRLQM